MNWKLLVSRVGMMAVAGYLLKDHPVLSVILILLWALNLWAGEPSCEEEEEDADITSNP